MLSAIELESMVNEASRLLDKACSVYRLTSTPNGYGGSSEAWTLLSSTLCRLVAKKPIISEFEAAGGLEQAIMVIVSLPVDEDVTLNDRLVIDSKTYSITGSAETSVKICSHWICRRLTI